MIIRTSEIQWMNNSILKDAANNYAKELCSRISIDYNKEIKEGQIIFKSEEAEKVIIELIKKNSNIPNSDYNVEKNKIQTLINNETVRKVKNKTAFYWDGIIYTPLTPLSNTQKNVYDSMLDFSKHVTFLGFGSEIGHYIADNLEKKIDEGLHEAIDKMSILYELYCWNNDLISDINDKRLKNIMLSKTSNNLQDYYKLFKEDLNGIVQNYIYDGYGNSKQAANYVRYLMKEYLFTRHFEGNLIFYEILKRSKNIRQSFSYFSNIMNSPKVNETKDALAMIGYSNKRIKKLRPYICESVESRAKIINVILINKEENK